MMGKWTEQEIATLRNLWQHDYPASIISTQVGHSRNAVLGKVFRLGMSNKKRATDQQKKHRAADRRRESRAVPAIKFSKPIVSAKTDAPEPLNLSLIDLQLEQCRWPVNTPQRGEEYLFCGHQKHEKSSYCEAHYKASLKADRWQV